MHPLMRDGSTLMQAVERERKLLEPVRNRAAYIFDTSMMTAAKMRGELIRLFAGNAREHSMAVDVISFGFKYGIPIDADLVFDVRFLPNPFYVEKLRPLSGMDTEVQEYVLRSDVAQRFLEKLTGMIDFLLPQYAAEGRYALTIGIGCTGGQHRSVAIAEATARYLEGAQYHVSISHRDLSRANTKA